MGELPVPFEVESGPRDITVFKKPGISAKEFCDITADKAVNYLLRKGDHEPMFIVLTEHMCISLKASVAMSIDKQITMNAIRRFGKMFDAELISFMSEGWRIDASEDKEGVPVRSNPSRKEIFQIITETKEGAYYQRFFDMRRDEKGNLTGVVEDDGKSKNDNQGGGIFSGFFKQKD